jgi:hypothetical protein
VVLTKKQIEELKQKLNKEELEKLKKNEELLESGGILRDYDNEEILYPVNLWILGVLEDMEKIAVEDLNNPHSFK